MVCIFHAAFAEKVASQNQMIPLVDYFMTHSLILFTLICCRVHEKLRENESRDGASFGTLFGSVLSLGIISRRTVYHEAIKYEKERNAGFLSPFGYSAAADAVFSMEV